MSALNDREVQIPEEWRRAVIAALASGDPGRIVRRASVRLEWKATFPNAWDHEWNDAIISALSVEAVAGRHITDMQPPCDTYAFWFIFSNTNLYGKIGLLPDGKVIILFSSHKPRKGERL